MSEGPNPRCPAFMRLYSYNDYNNIRHHKKVVERWKQKDEISARHADRQTFERKIRPKTDLDKHQMRIQRPTCLEKSYSQITKWLASETDDDDNYDEGIWMTITTIMTLLIMMRLISATTNDDGRYTPSQPQSHINRRTHRQTAASCWWHNCGVQ